MSEWEPSESDMTLLRFLTQAFGAFVFVGGVVAGVWLAVWVITNGPYKPDGGPWTLLLNGLYT